MSKPLNGAARNTMSEFERQCYDWGWQDNEQRIIKLLEKHDSIISRCCIQPVCCLDAGELIALIKGENK